MRPTLLFFCIFAIASGFEDSVDEIASFLRIKKNVVHFCFNETEALYNDIMQFDRLITDDLQYNYGTTYERVGCFFACLMQVEILMLNATLRTQVILNRIDSRQSLDQENDLNQKIITRCAERVVDITDACEVAFYFTICVLKDKRANKALDI